MSIAPTAPPPMTRVADGFRTMGEGAQIHSDPGDETHITAWLLR